MISMKGQVSADPDGAATRILWSTLLGSGRIAGEVWRPGFSKKVPSATPLRGLEVGEELLHIAAKLTSLLGQTVGKLHHLGGRLAGLASRLGDTGDVG